MLLTGQVATDGSRTGTWKDLACTGWAVTQLAVQGRTCVFSLWGPLEHSLPVQRRIARAELHAVLVALRNCTAPIEIYTDCALVLTGVEKGRRWATHSSRPNADLWAAIWDKLDDIGIGPDGVQVLKVRAHVSKRRQALEDEETQRLLYANGVADELAKLGAKQGSNEFLAYAIQAMDEEAAKVKGALDFIGGCQTPFSLRTGVGLTPCLTGERNVCRGRRALWWRSQRSRSTCWR